MQDEQPLSLQDELNLSEQQSDQQQPETSDHFRQIFTKIFTLLKTTNNSADNNNVTWLERTFSSYAFMGPTSTSVDWWYYTKFNSSDWMHEEVVVPQ